MQTPALQQRLSTYQQWKTRVGHAIHALETWLEDHRRATPAARAQLRAAQRALSRDRLTIAFVAECSHGKSELINAIFFADQGGRLLPSATGHSTLCPTELLWDDERNEAYLRLLPVETRVQDIPISQLKSDPKHWVHYPLSMQGPEQLALTLKEIRQTKTVAMAEATRLGLSSAGLGVDGQAAAPTVQIPKWRHAIVSLPHPLLKQGLVILDVPGATALGSEPELTSGLLPAVQAVVFVLATDVGVTRGDLEIWQHHLQGFQRGRQRPILVALNKVDALWMEQDTDAASDGLITAHRDSTAQALGIGQELVFPVSAQQALVAKLRNDDGLLRRSALPTLERHLATKVLESKYQSLVEAIDTGVGQILHRNRNRISSRISRVKTQLNDLEQLRDKTQDVIAQLLEKTRREQERYLTSVQQFQQSREHLLEQTRDCRRLLEQESIEGMIEHAQHELARSWTTGGMTQAMKGLFDALRRTMQAVATDSESIRKQVRETFQIFRDEFGFDVATPRVFVPMKHRVEIELLYQEMEEFRRSPQLALSGQGAVIRRFNLQLVSRAQVLFDQLRVAFDGWIRDTLRPLADEIQERKEVMEKRLENLHRIERSKDALQQRIGDMQTQYVGFAQDLTALRNIHNALHYDPLTEQEAPQRPRLVVG